MTQGQSRRTTEEMGKAENKKQKWRQRGPKETARSQTAEYADHADGCRSQTADHADGCRKPNRGPRGRLPEAKPRKGTELAGDGVSPVLPPVRCGNRDRTSRRR